MDILFLAQHCQSQHHVNRQARLWPDVRNGLTELGRREAECLARRLAEKIGERTCQVYTSRMQRTLETSQIVGQELGIAPEPVSDLHEYNGHLAMERTEDGEESAVDKSNWSLFDWREDGG